MGAADGKRGGQLPRDPVSRLSRLQHGSTPECGGAARRAQVGDGAAAATARGGTGAGRCRDDAGEDGHVVSMHAVLSSCREN